MHEDTLFVLAFLKIRFLQNMKKKKLRKTHKQLWMGPCIALDLKAKTSRF